MSRAPEAGTGDMGAAGTDAAPNRGCDEVEVDGDVVLELETDFTVRYRMGEPYTKTVMLFGGEPVEQENTLSNAYIFGLDKEDALMLADQYPDFYLCSSPGGQEAARHIVSYDLVPASCEVYEQILSALRQYNRNAAIGGDRTSMRFEGAPLELVSVTEDLTGRDATADVPAMNFHLVTSVEQLTGQSVIEFGTTQ